MVNLPSILLWGLVATSTLSIFLRGSQALSLTRMDIPLVLGTIVTSDRDKASFYGLVIHAVNGWIISLLYALVFESLGFAAWWLGVIGGGIQALFVLMVMLPVLPGLHPRMASNFAGPAPLKPLEPPGFMALNYGNRTPVVTIVAHLFYGLVLGLFYQPLA